MWVWRGAIPSKSLTIVLASLGTFAGVRKWTFKFVPPTAKNYRNCFRFLIVDNPHAGFIVLRSSHCDLDCCCPITRNSAGWHLRAAWFLHVYVVQGLYIGVVIFGPLEGVVYFSAVQIYLWETARDKVTPVVRKSNSGAFCAGEHDGEATLLP